MTQDHHGDNSNLRIAVLGANGKMGTAISAAIADSVDLDLVAQYDVDSDLGKLKDVDVVVDVTNPIAAKENLPIVASKNCHVVVGTSGLTDEDIEQLDELFRSANRSCLVVPNFSIGIVLMMQFVSSAAKYFQAAEIIELHHENKKDAPSGTSLTTAKAIAASNHSFCKDPTEVETEKGARGAQIEESLRIHSVRMPGLLAHQEVLLGGPGELLTIRHDSTDRVSFMPGVLRSVRGVANLQPGVTTGLEAVL